MMSLAQPAKNIDAVLFDLDGALIDTAPDLAFALNFVLELHQLGVLPYETIRPVVSNGADGLIKLGFGSNLDSAKQQQIKSEFINCYQQNIANKSVLFDGLEQALGHLERSPLSWGIVTNKPEHLTSPLLKALSLEHRPQCVICGDHVKNSKPHPEPIYLACKELNVLPARAIYIGDAERDMRAGNLAGLTTIACAYGYIEKTDDIKNWQADYIVESPNELTEWIMLAC